MVNQDEVNELIAKLENATAASDVATSNLRRTIAEAKTARAELENSIARSKKRGQGRW